MFGLVPSIEASTAFHNIEDFLFPYFTFAQSNSIVYPVRGMGSAKLSQMVDPGMHGSCYE